MSFNSVHLDLAGPAKRLLCGAWVQQYWLWDLLHWPTTVPGELREQFFASWTTGQYA